MLRRHINPIIGDLKANEIRKADLRELLETVKVAKDAGRQVGHANAKKTIAQPSHPDPPAYPLAPGESFLRAGAVDHPLGHQNFLEHDPTIGTKRPLEEEKAR
jgi:hypothetical protein